MMMAVMWALVGVSLMATLHAETHRTGEVPGDACFDAHRADLLRRARRRATVTVRLSPTEIVTLQDLADKQGITREDALRKALALNEKLVAEHRRGHRVLIERGGKLSQIDPA